MTAGSDIAARTAARLRRRRAVDRTVRVMAQSGLGATLAFLVVMLATIVVQGFTAFVQTEIRLPVTFDPAVIDPDGRGDPAAVGLADYGLLTRRAIESLFPDAVDRAQRRDLSRLISPGADLELRRMMLGAPSLLGATQEVWLPVSAPAARPWVQVSAGVAVSAYRAATGSPCVAAVSPAMELFSVWPRP